MILEDEYTSKEIEIITQVVESTARQISYKYLYENDMLDKSDLGQVFWLKMAENRFSRKIETDNIQNLHNLVYTVLKNHVLSCLIKQQKHTSFDDLELEAYYIELDNAFGIDADEKNKYIQEKKDILEKVIPLVNHGPQIIDLKLQGFTSHEIAQKLNLSYEQVMERYEKIKELCQRK